MISAEIQLQGEALLGKGLTADVFSWGENRVLKLFFPFIPKITIEREFAVTQEVYSAGVPSAAALEIVEVMDRHGIVFERVRGRSMIGQVESKPWTLFGAARQLAELHFKVHSFAAPVNMPSQQEQMEQWVTGSTGFTTTEKELARKTVAELPPTNRICHGDFHPANILMTSHGPVIIDWSTGTRGHPLADVARTSVLFEHAKLPEWTALHIKLLMKVARGLLHKTYLERYLKLSGGTLDEIEKWRVPQRMAASAWEAERKSQMAGILKP